MARNPRNAQSQRSHCERSPTCHRMMQQRLLNDHSSVKQLFYHTACKSKVGIARTPAISPRTYISPHLNILQEGTAATNMRLPVIIQRFSFAHSPCTTESQACTVHTPYHRTHTGRARETRGTATEHAPVATHDCGWATDDPQQRRWVPLIYMQQKSSNDSHIRVHATRRHDIP